MKSKKSTVHSPFICSLSSQQNTTPNAMKSTKSILFYRVTFEGLCLYFWVNQQRCEEQKYILCLSSWSVVWAKRHQTKSFVFRFFSLLFSVNPTGDGPMRWSRCGELHPAVTDPTVDSNVPLQVLNLRPAARLTGYLRFLVVVVTQCHFQDAQRSALPH